MVFAAPIEAGWSLGDTALDPVAAVLRQIVPLIYQAAAQDEAAGIDVMEPGQVVADEPRIPRQRVTLLNIDLELIALGRAQLMSSDTGK